MSVPTSCCVYPEGNYIHVSDDRPFLQIGESKYGKFMLELAVHAKVDMDTAIKIALSSMISTAHANLSVGPPYDLGVYRNGSLDVDEARVEADSPYLARCRACGWRTSCGATSVTSASTGSRRSLRADASTVGRPTQSATSLVELARSMGTRADPDAHDSAASLRASSAVGPRATAAHRLDPSATERS